MGKRIAILSALLLLVSGMANAGVLRNVVRPVVKTTARVSAHVVVKTAKVVKTVAY